MHAGFSQAHLQPRRPFIGSFATLTDITDRKNAEQALRESEQKFRQFFHSADDAILLDEITEDGLPGRFIEANEAACRRYGYSRDELLTMSPADLNTPDSAANIPAVMKSLLADRQCTFEMVNQCRDGKRIPVEINAHIIEMEGRDVILAIIRDITERKQAEEERRALETHLEGQKRIFYRETLLSVTEGKLDMCDESDVRPYFLTCEFIVNVRAPEEVSDARREIRGFCEEHGLAGEPLQALMIAVGEAITNALKHAGEGIVCAGARNGNLWVGVEDRGPGIESLILPRAVLLRGFSTKPSMGLGYCIMLEVADQIHLKTDNHGTVVILEKRLHERPAEISVDNLPDTW